ncbi:MAG: Pyridoxine 4-dehydrogenase [Myxococcaceae bacterium]|nr:Pyridoxine 4-dehydrogenase [Myxococcaceae bacterium]
MLWTRDAEDEVLPTLRIAELAKQKATASQLSLAWVMVQADFIVPMPGTKRRTYLEQNVRAAERLSRDYLHMSPCVSAYGLTAVFWMLSA